MCPRGQFMQMFSRRTHRDLGGCAMGRKTGSARAVLRPLLQWRPRRAREARHRYWTDWVGAPHAAHSEMAESGPVHRSPRYLLDRYRDAFGCRAQARLPRLRLRPDELHGRSRLPASRSRSATSARTSQPRGSTTSSEAFGQLRGECRLRIWGRNRGQDTETTRATSPQAYRLTRPAASSGCRSTATRRSCRDVFDTVDAIVVPSVWARTRPSSSTRRSRRGCPSSPRRGGMAEYVRHEVNGLLFEHRSRRSLASQMQRFVDDPLLAAPRQSGLPSTARRGTCRRSKTTFARSRTSTGGLGSPRHRPRRAPPGTLAGHVRHQPRHLQPALHHVRGALPAQPAPGWPEAPRDRRDG
jgi:hypothetical protein